MIVMKFGGTSVEDARAISRLAEIVKSRLDRKPVVIVSAMAKMTDSLVAMSHAAANGALPDALKLLRQLRQRHFNVLSELVNGKREAEVRDEMQQHFDSLQDVLRGIASLGELSPRTTDNVLSYGEVLSSRMVAAALAARGLNATHVDSRKVIVTDNNFTRAVPLDETNDRLREAVKPLVNAGKVPIMGGFIASTVDGITTTLGRGGSDFSAAIVGAALGARRIEIWTDVSGMMTTDPRLCLDAQRIDAISFDEASELAYFGAKVLHPATLIPAVEKNIPVFVLNSREPSNPGTCIRSKAPKSRNMFRAIAAKKGVRVINIRSPRMLMAHGFLRAVFEAFDRHGVAADLVSTSEVSVSVIIDGSRDVTALLEDLRKLGKADVENGKAIICLVGENVRGRVGMAASVFTVAAGCQVSLHMISQGASEINISFVIEEVDVPDVVRALHARFFPPKAEATPRRRTNGLIALPDELSSEATEVA
ncbi:MAG TPA: lysine-sensitive aspartokinase 3 [Terriglobales bacterium]|nr:lysine-sensitive aspartokinase 3 [Terriglobales bacterium]